MSPVDISAEFNPLRLASDRRLNRIAGPSALVIFGVTGDLSRKKVLLAETGKTRTSKKLFMMR